MADDKNGSPGVQHGRPYNIAFTEPKLDTRQDVDTKINNAVLKEKWELGKNFLLLFLTSPRT